MSKRAVDTVFEAIFSLTDLRTILRETAPSHDLDSAQRAAAEALLTRLEKDISVLKEELLS